MSRWRRAGVVSDNPRPSRPRRLQGSHRDAPRTIAVRIRQPTPVTCPLRGSLPSLDPALQRSLGFPPFRLAAALGASSRAVDGLGSNSQTCLRGRVVVCAHDAIQSIVRYGVSVLGPARVRSRGSGCRAGWPSCSHRPASIDPSMAHSIAVSLSHRPRDPRYSTSGAGDSRRLA